MSSSSQRHIAIFAIARPSPQRPFSMSGQIRERAVRSPQLFKMLKNYPSKLRRYNCPDDEWPRYKAEIPLRKSRIAAPIS
jgi:hypothetical protein